MFVHDHVTENWKTGSRIDMQTNTHIASKLLFDPHPNRSTNYGVEIWRGGRLFHAKVHPIGAMCRPCG